MSDHHNGIMHICLSHAVRTWHKLSCLVSTHKHQHTRTHRHTQSHTKTHKHILVHTSTYALTRTYTRIQTHTNQQHGPKSNKSNTTITYGLIPLRNHLLYKQLFCFANSKLLLIIMRQSQHKFWEERFWPINTITKLTWSCNSSTGQLERIHHEAHHS